MKRFPLFLLCAALSAAVSLPLSAQESAEAYAPVPVTVSKQKIKDSEGRIYFSHVVLERQTLFSIAHAYGVTVRDILDANPSVKGPEDLKKNAIILIPDLAANEKKARKDRKRQKTEPEPLQEATSAAPDAGSQTPASPEKPAEQTPPAAADSSGAQAAFDGLFPGAADSAQVQTKPQRPGDAVKATLLLPFKIRNKGISSRNNFDLYCGVLLAVKELGEQGIGTDLSVYDITLGLDNVPKSKLKETEIVLGPVHTQDVAAALRIVPGEIPLVSPLSHETASMVHDHPAMVQMAPSYFFQYRDLVRWVKEDLESGEQVLLVTEKTARDSDAASRMTELMASSGLEYTTISYGILEGRSITTSFERLTQRGRKVRVLLASDNEGFTADVLRNLNVLSHRGREIVLYGPSRIRSFDTIETSLLHQLNLHVSLSYYVDYDRPEVRDFILAYRALFNTEPTPFAFQGYDMARFFLRRGAAEGTDLGSLPEGETVHGLQTDFKFVRSGENGGYVNTAVRRIVYRPDYSVEVAR